MGIQIRGSDDSITPDDGTMVLNGISGLRVGTADYPATGPLSNRNMIVNGAFQVDQRNSGSSITLDSGGTTSGFPVDRLRSYVLGTGELDLTLQQVTDAPAGFRNSVKVTVATAESSGATPAADDRASCQLRLEGNTVESLALGTSDAKDFVVSFYVKSSLTGNFGVAITGSNRSYPVLYNIASANTWERKVIKVPGPTDGTWSTGTSLGFALKFGLYTGSNRAGADQGTDGTGTWQTSGTPQGVTNQTQIGGTVNATWQITGVQLEVGQVATPFEHRSYGDELLRCQRYFQQLSNCELIGSANTSTRMRINGKLITEMRTPPTVTRTSVSLGFQDVGATKTSTNTSAAQATTQGVRYMAFDIDGFSSLGSRSYGGADAHGNGAVFNCDAEL